MIWRRLREHLEIHSRDHAYFDFWMNLTHGTGDNRKPIQHLKKLRPVTLEREKFSFISGQTTSGLRKRIKGKLITFGPPLPGAEPKCISVMLFFFFFFWWFARVFSRGFIHPLDMY
jgi:hypothetical protein